MNVANLTVVKVFSADIIEEGLDRPWFKMRGKLPLKDLLVDGISLHGGEISLRE